MLYYLKKIFSDNNPLILGFGREGYSTYNLIRKLLPDVWMRMDKMVTFVTVFP